jgi:hypothetical protein
MLTIKCIQSVSERDIDLLIVEELESSTEFRDWLAARIYGEPVFKAKVGAWHSVSHPTLGESDILFLFGSDAGSAAAILIENKIDATPQPEQGKRYRERGAQGQAEGQWNEYRTCVLAPQKYLKSAKHNESYDVEVSYEEILAYFASRRTLDPRFAHKALLLKEGIDQNRRGYQPTVHPGLTKFVEDYHNHCSATHPDLRMETPKPRPALSTWITFRPKGLPKGAYIAHQLTAGCMKLFLPGMAQHLEEMKKKYEPHLSKGIEIIATGKSLALSVEVPVIEDPRDQPFSKYVDAADVALKYAVRLWETYMKGSNEARS